MERRSELENRAFQLQRLKETGYHIEILYEAKEAPDSLQSETGNSSQEERMVKADLDAGDGQGGKGVSEALPDREFLIYENDYQTARIVLDAITAVCLFDWLEQLKELNVNDSLTWRFVQRERQVKKNENISLEG